MKKLAVILMILALLLQCTGQGVMHVLEHSTVYNTFNPTVETFMGEDISPKLVKRVLQTGVVSDLLNGGEKVTLDSFLLKGVDVTITVSRFKKDIAHYTINDLLQKEVSGVQIVLFRAGMWCYAYAWELIMAGIGLGLLAFLLALASGRRRTA